MPETRIIPSANVSDSAGIDSVDDIGRLVNWLPVDALFVGGKPCVSWMDMRGVELVEPFFSQTVARARQAQPPKAETVTGLEALIQLEKITDSLAPSGFIFHTSRCGSTLLANACRALDGAIVISEAPVIDKLVGRFFSYSDADTAKTLFNSLLLRGALSALGQRRLGTEQRLFIKFSCLSVLQFEQIKQVWPSVPCVFMFRDPLEVIMSNLGNPPEWMQFESVPEQAAAVTGLAADEALKLDSEERCARALGRFYAAGAEMSAHGARLFDYADLSLDALINVISFLGVRPGQAEIARISQVAELYSKDSSRRGEFDPETSRKPAATSRAREVAEDWALSAYHRLKQATTQHRQP